MSDTPTTAPALGKLTEDQEKTYAFLCDGAAWGDEASTHALKCIDELRREVARLTEALKTTEPSATALIGPAPDYCDQDLWNQLIAEKGHFIAVVQRLLETQKSDAGTWQDAIVDRIKRLTEDRDRLTELRAAVADWVDARNRLAQIPYRPGSIGHTFVANQVERGVARIDAAYAAVDAARREDAATRTSQEKP